MKKILLIATGGTIAALMQNEQDYKAGVLDTHKLINQKFIQKMPIKLDYKQLVNKDSNDMSIELWFELLKLCQRALKQYDALIITHGSDTLEESAYFLSLCLKAHKPVIFTAAMRAFDALASDGTKNLKNALVLASKSALKGVFITINDKIFSPRSFVKSHTLNLNAFSSKEFGDLGYIINEELCFYEEQNFINLKHKPYFKGVKSLACVHILYAYVEDELIFLAQKLFENKSKGLIIAANGAGELNDKLKKALLNLMQKGLVVVIASRVFSGKVLVSKENENLGFINAHLLNPQKARIALALALNQGLKDLNAFFKSL